MTLDQSDEKHRFHRIFYGANAQLTSDDKVWPCQIIDISLNGCLLRMESTWQQDLEKLYTLTLHLSVDVTITMELSVTHVVDNTVGFKCQHIELDSMTQLKRMVELNLGDSQLLERDLLSLSEFN